MDNETKTLQQLHEVIQHLREQIQQLQIEEEKNQERSLGLENDSLNEFHSGNIAWMLFASVFVFAMTIPGVMLYYSGMVRIQNALSTAMQGYAITAIISFLWLCFGYSLAFGPSNSTNNTLVIGDSSKFWLHNIWKENSFHQLAPTIPETLFCSYQLAFAIITPTLICGAFADRMKFMAVLVTLGLWHLIVYCPVAHSNWHPDGFLHKAGVIDFAGGNVVHVSAGTSALVAALIVGKRTGIESSNTPHNLLLSLVGSCLLMVGWTCFNAGSSLAADESAAFAMLNTMISGSLSAIAWTSIEIGLTGKPSVFGVMNGYIAGFVGITPAAGLVSQSSAFIVGIVCGVTCRFGSRIKNFLNFDDSLDAFGIHCVAGITGGLLVGLFANDAIGSENGVIYGKTNQLGLQLYGIVITMGWSAFGTGIIFMIVDKIMGLRVDQRSELMGLDQSEHGTTLTSQATGSQSKRGAVEQKKNDFKFFIWFCSFFGTTVSADNDF